MSELSDKRQRVRGRDLYLCSIFLCSSLWNIGPHMGKTRPFRMVSMLSMDRIPCLRNYRTLPCQRSRSSSVRQLHTRHSIGHASDHTPAIGPTPCTHPGTGPTPHDQPYAMLEGTRPGSNRSELPRLWNSSTLCARSKRTLELFDWVQFVAVIRPESG